MAVLSNIEPLRVMHYFEEISAIPHGSRNTKAISDYLVNFAKDHQLKYIQDELNNVIIWKQGSKGHEESDAVIIQGHMDMVCEVAPGCTKDMDKEGLELYVEDGKVRAKDTTLGGDDGIAVAMALAILDDEKMVHPPIEVIITVDEEIGLLGAADIDLSEIKGRKMLNIDSEDEGIFTVSCAGGAMAHCGFKVNRETLEGTTCLIKITGLMGGHSGVEINKNRANASVLLGRFLNRMSKVADFRIISANGGAKDNAIACEASAEVMLTSKCTLPDSLLEDFSKDMKVEFGVTDPDIKVEVSCKADIKTEVLTEECTNKVIYSLISLPNGVIRMSPEDSNFVQTSLNLGIFKITDSEVMLTYCVRSSVTSEKKMLLDNLSMAMKMIGGTFHVEGDYPGWVYKAKSELRDIMVQVFTEQYGYAPRVEAIHAGVECGYFADKLDGLDCVSFGPNLREIHTYRESMEIESVQRVYKMVVTLLERLA